MATTARRERRDKRRTHKSGERRPRRRANKRPELLDAAAGRFREQGYDAASMRDIAGDAGMLAGSMYYYFRSKEEMLVAVHEDGIRRITQAVEQALEGVEGPWPRLQAAMAAHLSALLDGGDYAQVVIREMPPEPKATRLKLVRLRDGYEDIFRRLVDALPMPRGASRKHLRLMLMGALNWSQTWYRPGGDRPEAIARQFLDFVRRGLEEGRRVS